MKKKILYPLVIALAVGGGYFGYTKLFPPAPTRSFGGIAVVSTGSLRSVVKTTGKIYPIQESTLSFAKQGKVTELVKKVGDRVSTGDLIAQIDAKSAKLDVASAQVSLSNAQNNLAKISKGSTEVERIRAENALAESKANLIKLQNDLESLTLEQKNTLAAADANIALLTDKVALAQSDLEYAQKNITTDTTSNNLERDIAASYATLESVYSIVSPSLKTISDTLLLQNKSNATYGAIGENNPTLKNQTEVLYSETKKEYDAIDATMNETRKNKTSLTSVLTSLSEMKTLIGDLNTLTSLSISTLRASQAGPDLESSFLDTKISTIDSLASSISAKFQNVNTSLATLKNYGNDDLQALADTNTVSGKKSALLSVKNDLESAKRNQEATKKSYENKILTAEQGIESAKNTITLNTASYDEIQRGAESTEVISARNSVQSSQISLEKARLTLADYQIHASLPGVIKDIPWALGATTLATEGVSVDIDSGYEIQVSLDQTDIVKVKSGMKANITLDAYAETTFTGVVSSISGNPTETSGVVSYTAKIVLPKTEKEILESMSATVEIVIAEKENILVIPSAATVSENGKTYVSVISGGTPGNPPTKKEVLLGIADNGKVEVLSGVTLGEKIRNNSTIMRSASGSSTPTSGNRSGTRSGFGAGMSGPPPGF